MRKIITRITVLMVIVASCTPSNSQETQTISPSPDRKPVNTTTSTNDNGCLPPLTSFSFPNGETEIAPTLENQVLPGVEWVVVTSIPEIRQTENISLELFDNGSDGEELWVLTSDFQGVYRYNLNKQTWLSSLVKENSPYASGTFIVQDDRKNLWMFKRWNTLDVPFLSLYNAGANKFESIVDKDGIFSDGSNLTVNVVKKDKEGVFWLLVENHAITASHSRNLISFNPSTLKAKIYLENPNYVDTLAVSTNGSLFLIDANKKVLVKYMPSTKELMEYPIPVSSLSQSLSQLYLDKSDHLWLNDEGWFDLAQSPDFPKWFFVVRSPVFIDYFAPAMRWNWSRPQFLIESQDDRLWFTSTRGTGWLDPKDGIWCIFTSYSSNVIEDQIGDLWMTADGKLYKLPLNP